MEVGGFQFSRLTGSQGYHLLTRSDSCDFYGYLPSLLLLERTDEEDGCKESCVDTLNLESKFFLRLLDSIATDESMIDVSMEVQVPIDLEAAARIGFPNKMSKKLLDDPQGTNIGFTNFVLLFRPEIEAGHACVTNHTKYYLFDLKSGYDHVSLDRQECAQIINFLRECQDESKVGLTEREEEEKEEEKDFGSGGEEEDDEDEEGEEEDEEDEEFDISAYAGYEGYLVYIINTACTSRFASKHLVNGVHIMEVIKLLRDDPELCAHILFSLMNPQVRYGSLLFQLMFNIELCTEGQRIFYEYFIYIVKQSYEDVVKHVEIVEQNANLSFYDSVLLKMSPWKSLQAIKNIILTPFTDLIAIFTSLSRYTPRLLAVLSFDHPYVSKLASLLTENLYKSNCLEAVKLDDLLVNQVSKQVVVLRKIHESRSIDPKIKVNQDAKQLVKNVFQYIKRLDNAILSLEDKAKERHEQITLLGLKRYREILEGQFLNEEEAVKYGLTTYPFVRENETSDLDDGNESGDDTFKDFAS